MTVAGAGSEEAAEEVQAGEELRETFEVSLKRADGDSAGRE